jgi:nucleotide-binding universal stress UspA family protein
VQIENPTASKAEPFTVVVGVDYSETGRLALRRALAVSDAGAVHVVHVVEALAPPSASGMPLQVSFDTVPMHREAAALRQYVEEQLLAWEHSERRNVSGVVSHLAQGAPAEEIVQLAADVDADLIVVGTHGRRGVQRLVRGSTAERVVRLASCPVLVEKPKANAFRGARDVELGPLQ